MLSSQQRIVVLDDDEDSLNYFKIMLKPFTCCEIKYYTSPDENFVEYVNNNDIDLFIMDIVLQDDQSGLNICEEIVFNKRGSIFLFVSGYDYDINSFEHLRGKCVYDFLSKPIDVSELNIVVSTLLNVASSYKVSFVNTRVKPRESQMDSLRKNYMDLIKQDQILIKKLKETNTLSISL